MQLPRSSVSSTTLILSFDVFVACPVVTTFPHQKTSKH